MNGLSLFSREKLQRRQCVYSSQLSHNAHPRCCITDHCYTRQRLTRWHTCVLLLPPPTRTWSSHTTHNTTSRHPTPRPLTVRPSAGAGAGLRYTKALLMALTELEKGVSWPKRPKRLKPSSLPPIIDCNDVRGCYRGQPIAQSDTLRTVAHPITRG